jgi:hypothetical protein
MNVFDNKDFPKPDIIIDKLYVGNLMTASDKEGLKTIGITHILISASYIEPLFPNVINNNI